MTASLLHADEAAVATEPTAMALAAMHVAASDPCVTLMPRLVAIRSTDRPPENAA